MTTSLPTRHSPVDVRHDPSPGDGGLDERVQLLVPPDGQLQVPGSDPLDVQVLGGVTGQLHHLDMEVSADQG